MKQHFKLSNFQCEDLSFLHYVGGFAMDDYKIIEEIGNQFLEESSTPAAPAEWVNKNDVEEQLVLSSIGTSETDLHVIQNKRVELDGIQRDLDDLMSRLNTFIADSQDDCPIDNISLSGLSLEEEEEIINISEKQDGPPEKELRLTTCATGESLTNIIYTTDGTNPPEINWEAVGPILQKHVSDLQKLHNLNQMTNAVVKRIRNVTQINDELLKTTNNKEGDV